VRLVKLLCLQLLYISLNLNQNCFSANAIFQAIEPGDTSDQYHAVMSTYEHSYEYVRARDADIAV
jgi:hypothetical protein